VRESLKNVIDGNRPIAVVDDNADDLFFLQHELKALFGERKICLFASGRGLLQYLQSHHLESEQPALVVLDLHMAHTDGFQTLEYLRKHLRFANIPVVVVSGTQDKRDVQAALMRGANAFMAKPFSRGDFIKILSDKTQETIN